jgi:hypothetical protein
MVNHMTKNVGELDAYCRITGGLTLLGIGIMGSSKTLTFLGAMKVAEGITRFCPMMYLLNMNTLNWELNLKKDTEEETEVPVEG